MKFKLHRFSIILVLLLVISIGFNIATAVTDGTAEPGSEQDPLITKGYVDEIMEINAAEIAKLKQQLEDLKNQQQSGGSEGFAVLTLETGQTLLSGAGTELVLRSGKATGVTGKDGNLADVTSAKDLTKGTAVVVNHLLISSRDDGRGLKASTKCFLLIRGAYKITGQQQAESSVELPPNDSGSGQTGNDTPVENEPPKGKVNATTGLNVRSEPNTSASSLAILSKGEVVYMLSIEGDWMNIKTSAGISGWVKAEYITMQ